MSRSEKFNKVKAKIKKEIVPMEFQNVKENIYNIPNFLTLSRMIITLVLIYLIFNHATLNTIAILFIIGAITDALDGNIARLFNMKTKFGAKFDMVADRFLFVGIPVALIISYVSQGIFGSNEIIQFVMILSREIIALPFAIVAYMKGNMFPSVKVIGKVTTVLQTLAIGAILFQINVLVWSSVFLTCMVGILSGITYAKDFMNISKNKK